MQLEAKPGMSLIYLPFNPTTVSANLPIRYETESVSDPESPQTYLKLQVLEEGPVTVSIR
jgi:hypothetical protein